MKYLSLYKAFSYYKPEEFNKLYQKRFNSESTMKFNFKINNYQAFLFYNLELIELLTEIKEIEKRVNIAFNSLPDIAKSQYQKKSMIDEIEFTNKIEGIISTRKDINDIIEDIQTKNIQQKRLRGIVNKYLLLIKENKIEINTAEDVRKIYDDMLFEEIYYSNKDNLPDGKLFRKENVSISSSVGKIIHKGMYPEEKIIEGVNNCLKILNDKSIDVYIRVAIFHYLFSYVHPFYDGNGRINRFISSYVLSKNSLNLIGCRVSLTIKENLADYYDTFKYTNDPRNRGDITLFVIEFLKIIYKAYEKTELYALDKKKIIEEYFGKIEKMQKDKKIISILKILIQIEVFSEYGLSVENISKQTKLSKNTVRKYLNILKNQKIIKEIKNSKRIYYSANLIEIE